VAAQASRDRQQREYAIANLLKALEDETGPNRLKTLQSLFSYSSSDNPAISQALHKALQDPDPTIVACAVEAIAARDDAEALGALASTFRTGDVSTKLLIVESVTSNMAAHSILHEGLSDSAEEVRDAAKAALYAFSIEQSPEN
jgi:HEAT repeat protein